MSQAADSSREALLDKVLGSFLRALDAGQAPDRQQLLARYPELASELESFFRDQDKLRQRLTDAEPTTTTFHSLPDPFPGQFRILKVLGEGAFGKVLLAEDLNLGWKVALKTLKLPATSTLGPHVLAALRKDGKHLAQLDHPNIVRVHAWLEAGGEYYLVMQYVAGGSLGARLKKEKVLSWQDAARYVADVGEALVEAHKRGVIHRDIKPDNILWDEAKDEAMLTDFGVSARLAEQGSAAGTPVYMAPEAFDGHVSPALDVYSLAATLYRLVTGELPFAKAPVPSLLYQKQQGLPDPDPNCACIPEALERIIRAGLAAKPDERPSMADFVARLRAALNQLLADALVPAHDQVGHSADLNLQIVVSRLAPGDFGAYRSIAATQPQSGSHSRDMKKVPRSPDRIPLRTGDQVRVEVVATRRGYVTVFNVGPTGNLNLLYPDEQAGIARPLLEANTPLHILDVVMTPPVGRERLFAVWTRNAMTLSQQQMGCLAQSKGVLSAQYQASRDMKRLQEEVNSLKPQDWYAEVIELDHNG